MRLLRSLVVSLLLSLLLGASVASAAEAPSPPAGREASLVSRILGHLGVFLMSVWANEGWQIDPWGHSTLCADEGWEIDPWGRCLPSSAATPSSDQGWDIDPLG